ncbi:MAG: Transposase [Firmicutes bacterium]|nr:Transposase [Bacillota bacterium]
MSTQEKNLQYLKEYRSHGLNYVMNKYHHAEITVKIQVSRIRSDLNLPSLKANFTDEFKREVVEYFKTHTYQETTAKYNIGKSALYRWRKKIAPPTY